MRQILHVDCDCFFAAVEMRDQPKYQHLPIAIGGAKDRRGVISTCNYPARKYGVRSALATSQALKLCPNLILLPGDMAKYKAVSKEVMDILRQYAFSIEPVSIDEAFLELAPTSNAPLVAKQIREHIESQLGITVSVGIAPNKFLAKVASDWRKPNGQFLIEPSDVTEFVARLPIKRIPGVGPKGAQKLNDIGIYTCGDINKINKESLIQRFGKFAQMLLLRAQGEDDRPVAISGQRKSISIERTFAQDINAPDDIQQALEDMWPTFLSRVEQARLSCTQLAPFVKIKFADFQVTTLANHHKTASIEDYKALIAQAVLRADKAIRLIGIGGRLVVGDDRQLPLFN